MPLLRDITSETGMASLSRAQVTTSPMITTPATAHAQHFNTDDFIMGPDTCGFTSGTTSKRIERWELLPSLRGSQPNGDANQKSQSHAPIHRITAKLLATTVAAVRAQSISAVPQSTQHARRAWTMLTRLMFCIGKSVREKGQRFFSAHVHPKLFSYLTFPKLH